MSADPVAGLLLQVALSGPALATLVRADDADAALPHDDVRALAAAGALDDGRPSGMLADALPQVRAPMCELWLERGERRGRGWVGPTLSALHTPAGDGWTLTVVPTVLLCDVLGRMIDLGPRPRAQGASRLRLAAGALAEVLAARSPDPGSRLLEPAGRELLRGLAESLRDHWRIEARWEPAPESAGVRALEVVDTDTGVWLVVPDADHVELWPSTPTAVWRLLTALLPRDHELADGEAGGTLH
jgi:hypothetical protein